MCKHEIEYLVGVAGGVICRKCGQHFDHIPKQETEAKPKAVLPSLDDIEEAPAKKSVKKAPARKPAAKKGAK